MRTQYPLKEVILQFDSFISKNRSSLSDEELRLLSECLDVLKKHQDKIDESTLNDSLISIFCKLAKPEVVDLILSWVMQLKDN
jgi:hypothetical protein